jgi:hypothetical protein
LVPTSAVHGEQLSRPLVDGAWTKVGQVWTVTVRSMSLADGTTQVWSRWRSPVITPFQGKLRFAARVAVHNQDVIGRYGYSDMVRVCARSGCGKWFGESADSLPSAVDPNGLPFFLRADHGLAMTWGSSHEPQWIEWRYLQRQHGTGMAETTIRVAVGQGAMAV